MSYNPSGRYSVGVCDVQYLDESSPAQTCIAADKVQSSACSCTPCATRVWLPASYRMRCLLTYEHQHCACSIWWAAYFIPAKGKSLLLGLSGRPPGCHPGTMQKASSLPAICYHSHSAWQVSLTLPTNMRQTWQKRHGTEAVHLISMVPQCRSNEWSGHIHMQGLCKRARLPCACCVLRTAPVTSPMLCRLWGLPD